MTSLPISLLQIGIQGSLGCTLPSPMWCQCMSFINVSVGWLRQKGRRFSDNPLISGLTPYASEACGCHYRRQLVLSGIGTSCGGWACNLFHWPNPLAPHLKCICWVAHKPACDGSRIITHKYSSHMQIYVDAHQVLFHVSLDLECEKAVKFGTVPSS